MILEGFGEKICQFIDKKLESFLADGGFYKIKKFGFTLIFS